MEMLRKLIAAFTCLSLSACTVLNSAISVSVEPLRSEPYIGQHLRLWLDIPNANVTLEGVVIDKKQSAFCSTCALIDDYIVKNDENQIIDVGVDRLNGNITGYSISALAGNRREYCFIGIKSSARSGVAPGSIKGRDNFACEIYRVQEISRK
jgi:hypothetical protein